MKKKMPRWQKRLWRDGIIVGLLALTALGLVGEIARQDWHTKVTAYPTKSDTAIELQAQELLDEMTLEEKVGQMFLVRCTAGTQMLAIQQYHVGGMTLYTEDFKNKTPTMVRQMLEDYEEAAEIPMLIGVDEEGGEVCPISISQAYRGSRFLSPRELFATGGLPLVETDTVEKSQLLLDLGINLNLAPVADITTDPNGMMYDRSLGYLAEDTARYVETVVDVMNDEGIVSAVKHFPGYGNHPADPSGGLIVDDRDLETLQDSDLLPYRRAIATDAPMIMISHNIISALDAELPASLSREVYDLLRRELGFEGVVVTDALSHPGLAPYGDSGQLAVQAIRAGADLLCTSDYKEQIPAVLKAIKAGTVAQERVDEAVLRILKLKIRFNLI